MGAELVLENQDLLLPLLNHLIDFEKDGVKYKARIIKVDRYTSTIKIVPSTTKD